MPTGQTRIETANFKFQSKEIAETLDKLEIPGMRRDVEETALLEIATEVAMIGRGSVRSLPGLEDAERAIRSAETATSPKKDEDTTKLPDAVVTDSHLIPRLGLAHAVEVCRAAICVHQRPRDAKPRQSDRSTPEREAGLPSMALITGDEAMMHGIGATRAEIHAQAHSNVLLRLRSDDGNLGREARR